MLFIHSCKAIVIYRNSYSKYRRCYKKMAFKELKDFIHEKSFRRIQFPKESSYYSMKYKRKTNFSLLVTKLMEKT